MPGDNQCLFHALLHALEAQVGDPRAREYTPLTLRHAILDLLCDPQLQDRAWVTGCDQNAISLTNLQATLCANAARFENRTFDEWKQAMRSSNEHGDANMLIGATLKLRRRIHVLSTADGLVTVAAPEIFGADFRPTGDDLWLALHSDVHYCSTDELRPASGSPYQRPPTRQPLAPPLAPQHPPGREQTRDERVAELERTVNTKGQPFKLWLDDQYKAICRNFSSSVLKGTLGNNGMVRAVRYERIVAAVRDLVHGAAVLAHVRIVALDDMSSLRTERRRADPNNAALDRAKNTEQREQQRATDAAQQRRREDQRRRTDEQCADAF